jgi:hypothetical protein
MFELGCGLLSPPQELELLRGSQVPSEDHAGQVGQLLKRFSSHSHILALRVHQKWVYDLFGSSVEAPSIKVHVETPKDTRHWCL